MFAKAILSFYVLVLSGFSVVAQQAGGPSSSHGSLFERVGGMPVISDIANKYVDILQQDYRVRMNPVIQQRFRPGFNGPEYRQRMVQYFCYVSGGPCPKIASPGHAMILAMNPSSAEWDYMEQDLAKALAVVGITGKDRDAFVSIFKNYRKSFEKR